MNQASKIGPTADEKNKWTFNASEYNYRYHQFQKEEAKQAKPAAVRLSDNRDTFQNGTDFTKNSSYEYDYAAKPTTAPIRVKRAMGPSSIAPAAELKMECNSSYRNSFDKKNARPAKTIRPPPPQGLQWVAGAASNIVNSVNMHVYRPYTADEVRTAKREKIVILPEYGTIDTNTETKPEMDFNTTVKQNFVQHRGNCRPPPAPGAIKMPAHGIAGIAGADINAKMDLTTTHRMVFNKNNSKIENYSKEIAVTPLRKDKTGKVPGWYKSVEFTDDVNVSTQMKDYCHHNGVVRPKSFQPLHEYNPPETKFHTATLYKNGKFAKK